ncbi:hypothetical protein SAMN05444411_11336 [Lutibacter oricola]|uniref:EpsG family protein n=1 Tax=Lutibacter oricola TaxID=762486 RepID=A0A1H3G665_9FLAO|nr:DUF6427 family protein [Lutibacter oricola]SDX97849.1 hypothetical protein SAMN05444411_11336 [Lutibacter oricola]
MIANFFSKSTPAKTFYLVILLCFYYVVAVINGASFEVSIVEIFSKVGYLLFVILFLFTVLFVIKKNTLTLDNLYALFLIVTLVGTFSEILRVNKFMLVNFILMLMFRKVYSLKSGLNTKPKLFDAGLWVGVATLIYFWSVLFIPLILIALVVYRKLSIKNIVIPFVGFVTPIFLMFTYYFYTDSFYLFVEKFIIETSFNFNTYNDLKIVIPIALLLTILLWSVISVTPKIVMISNKLKKAWNIILLQLLISLIIVVISPIKNGSELLFLIIPSSIVIANYLPKSNSTNFRNLILILFLIVSVVVNFL